jgi:hypothetical protein
MGLDEHDVASELRTQRRELQAGLCVAGGDDGLGTEPPRVVE